MGTSSLLTTAATVSAIAVMAASGAMLGTFASTTEQKDYLWGLAFDEDITLVIDQDVESEPNAAFQDAKLYMSPRISRTLSSYSTVCICGGGGRRDYIYSLGEDSVFTDSFNGVKLRWTFHERKFETDQELTYVKCYHLTFPKSANAMVLDSYLAFVQREAASTRQM